MAVKKLKLYHVGLLVLLVLSCSLRFINLSYSEFQDDEKKTQIKLLPKETVADFLLRQRKGPIQFFVAYVPFAFSKGEVNELAVRLPFTIANLLSVFILYALMYKITKSHLASLITSLLYSVNGFVVAFSRIAQYQNLNLLFSFLALYFFADLKYKARNFRIPALIGAIFFTLSLLSHWDAVYYFVPICFFFVSFLARKDVARREKLICFLIGFGIGAVLFLPFAVPYIFSLTSGQSGNIQYLIKRVGMDGSVFARHKFIFELYNPVITLPLYLAGLVLAIGFAKKTGMFLLWFLADLLIIKFLMVTPKTHIYNYVIPAILASSLGFYYAYLFVAQKVKRAVMPFLIIFGVLIGLLFWQSFQIFVDHKQEYPFDDKKILWHQNQVLSENEIITFGFPHNRNWKAIDDIVGPSCRWITNENKGLGQIYMRAENGFEPEGCLYLIVIKRPFYTQANNAVYAEAKKSKLVYRYIKDDEILTKVYKLR